MISFEVDLNTGKTDKDIPDELKDGNIPGSYAEPEKKKKKVT